MDLRTIEEQTLLGSQSVDRDIKSLRLAIHTRGQPSHRVAELAEVQSQTLVLKRHLNRLFALEEVDDYLNFVAERHPEFIEHIAQLKAQHAEFRRTINDLLVRLDAVESQDKERFDAICLDIHTVICRVLQHGSAEGKLLRRAVDLDHGGEG
jgi:hypothetical protein